MKDPCEDCLVKIVCIRMCPKVIKFYKDRVRLRPKHEVELATGYHWEDDYTDKDGKVHISGTMNRIEITKKEEEVDEKEKRLFDLESARIKKKSKKKESTGFIKITPRFIAAFSQWLKT